jgi:hypothetical protein
MAKSNVRRIRVVRNWGDARGYGPQDRVLVGVPREWAPAVASLIKISDEHRHVGLLVINVGPTSRAAIAGVARGDVLLRYNSVQLDDAETLRRVTVRGMQDYEPRKRVALEALRGAHEMTFEVERGELGITVSPLLHRFNPAQSGMKRSMHTSDKAGPPESGGPIFVEMRGEFVRKVLFLKKLIHRPSNSKQRKKIRSLLLTVARMG